jgi:UDP-N-acetylglucosamine--N-acetylmuramyl-(pentapeptide) pyrophosphoryl-undecaprenol N-acetylglucosamine transferase
VAGLTNKTLSHFASRVLSAFPAAFGTKATLVGNPVRKEITQVAAPESRMQTRSGPLRLLVVGGSLGAQALNQVLPTALATIAMAQRPQVVHQAGEKHITALKAHYEQAGVKAEALAYIEDMAAMYSWADIVICRAGALTIAELSAAGLASVLVPFPHAVDDHQTSNARYLADADAAILVSQSTFTAEKLAELIQSLSREQCLSMAIKARALGKPEATASVANICMELAA